MAAVSTQDRGEDSAGVTMCHSNRHAHLTPSLGGRSDGVSICRGRRRAFCIAKGVCTAAHTAASPLHPALWNRLEACWGRQLEFTTQCFLHRFPSLSSNLLWPLLMPLETHLRAFSPRDAGRASTSMHRTFYSFERPPHPLSCSPSLAACGRCERMVHRPAQNGRLQTPPCPITVSCSYTVHTHTSVFVAA
jgi:hypothetical protein